MPGFKLPAIDQNDEDWGPTTVPEAFRDVPFMPYSKGDRLGRIADFSQQASQRGYQGRYRDREILPGMAVFNFEKGEEDEAFELVDTRVVRKPPGGQRGRGGRGGWGQGRGDGGRPTDSAGRGAFGGGGARGRTGSGVGGRGGRPWNNWRDQNRVTYSSSVDIRPEWRVLGDAVPFTSLHKMSSRVGEPEDLAVAGSLAPYDRAADRVTPRTAVRLARAPAAAPPRRPATSSADPVLRALAAAKQGHVFATDELVATLMASPRSVYPWDMVVTRRGDLLFLDKRPGSSLDYVTNGETSPDPIPEDRKLLDGLQQLSAEATAVHAAFRAQVLRADGERAALEGPAPPPGSAPPAPVAGEAYRYRRWALGDIDLVVRCGVDGALGSTEGGAAAAAAPALLAVHAFNEFDPKWSGIDWRSKLENQRGAALATELKNNAAKVAKWTAAALMAGVDVIKLGYVTRASPKSSEAHLLLGTQSVKPADFAAQMNLSMDNAWGIVRALLELCYDTMEEDGTYLLVRDPNKPQLRLYAVPTEASRAKAEAKKEAAEAEAPEAAAAPETPEEE
ncbi:EIF3D [Auxenochlorella protothecoides x Auxenochlorella symbiontica]